MSTVEPGDLAECSEHLRRAAREETSVGFVGGGTALEVGNPGPEPGLVVSTRRLDRVVEYAPEDQVIVAEAGLTLARLAAIAAPNAQWFGVDAPLPERATLGGLVAVGAFGPRRLRYGGARDLLLGMTLVRADGEVAMSGSKVVKNVAGFDLPKVVCGSLGTLGLVARVILRLHPLPEATHTSVLENLSALQLVDVVRALRAAQLEPSSVVALRRGADRFAVGVRFEGFERGVTRDTQRWGERRPGTAAMSLEPEAGSAFWRGHDEARTTGRLRLRFGALPTSFPEVAARLEPLLGVLERPRLAWYPPLGVGFASGEPSCGAQAALAALALARGGLVGLGGWLVVEAAPPEVRQRFDAFGPPPNAFELMRALKQRFDPQRRLNPGRFVGGL